MPFVYRSCRQLFLLFRRLVNVVKISFDIKLCGPPPGRPSGTTRVRVTNGSGRTRRSKNGESVAESINFGPLEYWVGFNLRMAQESAFQAFSRHSLDIGER